MKIKNILLIYKKSAYQIYFKEKSKFFTRQYKNVKRSDITHFKDTHKKHYDALKYVESVLAKNGLKYKKYCRGYKCNYGAYDFVISVGGDGTFLEAARNVISQVMLGVNSDPVHSMGSYCTANRNNFKKIIANIVSGKVRVKKYHRIKLKVDKNLPIDVLNDILICHKNPAALSRYQISINGIKEEQRGSGIWIATASGSSGAIRSVGGRHINRKSRLIQYLPRDLQQHVRIKPEQKGGILKPGYSLSVRSMMRNGMIYIDGAHVRFSFRFGSVAHISSSSNILHII